MGQVLDVYNPKKRTSSKDHQSKIQQDPLYFFQEYLGDKPPGRYGLYPKQKEILSALTEYRRIAVIGANSTGKDYLNGRLVIWWLKAWQSAKVVIIAPTFRQIKDMVWKEARDGYFGATRPLGGKILDTPYLEFSDSSFARGLSTDQPYNLTGYHSPHLLVILSEAHGIEQNHIEAVKLLNPEKVIMTGNAFSSSGEFYDAFHLKSEQWKTITISAYDTPNIIEQRIVIPGMVTIEDIEEKRKDWGEDSPLFKGSVLANFSESLDDVLITRAWVENAIRRQTTEDERFKAAPVLACDVAREGEDMTVATLREGPSSRIVWKVNGKTLMEICGWLKGFLEDYNCEVDKWNALHESAEIKRQKLQRVVIDDVGIGGGVTDRLREQGVGVIAFKGGEKPLSDKWQDKNAEAWGLMSQSFRDGKIQIDNDLALVGQLCTRKYEIQSDRKIKLISKKDMKSHGLKSPDCGDSLAMTFTPVAQSGFKICV